MYALRNKETGKIVDPRVDSSFPICPADLGYETWDESLSANQETDLIDGFEVVNLASDSSVIEISMDGVWAGSGRLIDGRIEDCSAQFCDDNDESLEVYDLIENAIKFGKATQFNVEFSDGLQHTISWAIVEPAR